MNIKPLNDTATLKFSISDVEVKTLSNKKVRVDKEGIIPNGIYKVIRWENFRQKITLAFTIALTIAMSILIALYVTVFHAGWASFIIPTIVGLGALYKFTMTIVEFRGLSKAVRIYKEDLRVDLGSATSPTFISKIYRRLYEKQVAHNWLTFALIFYGGIFTVLLWWLKDVSWWIFEFKVWIHQLFANPTMMTWLFTAALILIVVVHIVFMIQRKARILDIDAYFGQQVTKESDIILIKQDRNKFYRRLFILSVMIFLIIPIAVKLILRLIRLKK